MQITVFGATGRVGSLVVEEALRRGYTVVAFAHGKDMFSPSGKLIVVQGDIYNAREVASALRGSEAVISCLGSWGTPKRNVLTVATEALIPAMREHNITRIVTVTGSGAQSPLTKPSALHKLFMNVIAPLPAGKVFKDGEKHMKLLHNSGLEWTTLRSPVMTNGGQKGYYLNLHGGGPLETIRREAVAGALLDQLDDDEYVGQAPILHRKQV